MFCASAKSTSKAFSGSCRKRATSTPRCIAIMTRVNPPHWREQNQWALRTKEELEATRRDLTTVLQSLHSAEATVIERTLWAQRLDADVQDLQGRLNLWRASRWTKLGRKLNLGPDLDQSPNKGDANGGGS